VDTDENRRRVCTVSGEEFHQPGSSKLRGEGGDGRGGEGLYRRGRNGQLRCE
jgi:hypothetical protein